MRLTPGPDPARSNAAASSPKVAGILQSCPARAQRLERFQALKNLVGVEVVQAAEFHGHGILGAPLRHHGTRTHRREHGIESIEIDQPRPALGQAGPLAFVTAPLPAEVAQDEDPPGCTVATACVTGRT